MTTIETPVPIVGGGGAGLGSRDGARGGLSRILGRAIAPVRA